MSIDGVDLDLPLVDVSFFWRLPCAEALTFLVDALAALMPSRGAPPSAAAASGGLAARDVAVLVLVLVLELVLERFLPEWLSAAARGAALGFGEVDRVFFLAYF